jgi:plastocyanin
MLRRLVLAGVLTAVMTLAFSTTVPAQTPRKVVIEVKMSSFKFEPNQIKFNEGDTVVLRLVNVDQQGRAHNLSSAWLLNTPLTIRGDGSESTFEGRKAVRVEAGKTAEVEFVAKGQGSAAFICSLFTHAANGMTGAFFVGPPQ